MWKWFIAVALTTFAVFSSTITSDFVWDDQQFVLENQSLTSFKKLPQLFTENMVAGAGITSNLYRPLQAVTHMVDLQIWGSRAWGHHLTNVLLASLAAGLLFLFLRSLIPDPSIKSSAIAAVFTLLYTCHPLQSQIVGYVSGRGDTLVLIFLLTAALSFRRSFALCLTSVVLGICSKESGLLIAPFLLLLDFFQTPEKKSFAANWSLHLAIWLPVAAYLILRMTVLNFHSFTNFYGQENLFTQNFHYRLLTYFATFAKGTSLWFWPMDLHHERGWGIVTGLTPMTIFGALIWLSMLISGLALWKRAPLLSFGFLWYLGATIPTSNLLIIINALFYDHWFVLPGLGFPILLCWMKGRSMRKEWLILALAIWVFEVWGTQKQNRVWQGPESLYRHILSYEPDSAKILNNLAMTLADTGKIEEAVGLYKKSIQQNDIYAQTHHNLGMLYLRERNFELALQSFQRALQMDPRLHQSWTYLAVLKFNQGKNSEAAAMAEQSLKVHPTAMASEILIQSLKSLGRSEQAAEAEARARSWGFSVR